MATEHQNIRHLGFVIDSRKANKEVTHALVNMQEEQDQWYVIALSPSLYNEKLKDYVGRYFRTIFGLSIKIWETYKKGNKLKKGYLFLNNNDVFDRQIAKYLREASRRDKGKSASKDFPDIKRAIYYTLFGTQGSEYKNNLRTIWRGPSKPSAIFLWTHLQFKESPLKNVEGPFEKIAVPNLSVDSTLEPSTLKELADLFLFTPDKMTWQNLYRKAIIRSIQTESFLELSVIPMPGKDNKEVETVTLWNRYGFPQRQMRPYSYSILRNLEESGKILLTGPAGIGKTTMLQNITCSLALGNETIESRYILPLYIPIKWFGIWPKYKTQPPRIPEYIAFWIRHTIHDHLSTSDIRQCELFSSRKTIPYEDMLDEIERKVISFFNDDQSDLSNVVFFFDAFNEVSEMYSHVAKTEIERFSRKAKKVVVSTRSYISHSDFPEFARFELNELFDDEIVKYLDLCFDSRGQQIFDESIIGNSRILSMARVPFYLALIVDYHKDNPNKALPTSEGSLLRFFVQRQYDNAEKKEIKSRLFDDITQPQINFFLAKCAYRLVQKGEEEPETVLDFPHELADILPAFTIRDLTRTAQAAELFGFLEKSGQIPRKPGELGAISFRHENLRDFFAAVELNNLKLYHSPKIIKNHLEYVKWDNVWQILFGIFDNEQECRKTLLDIAKLDTVFASTCLSVSMCRDRRLGDKLLEYLDISRIEFLTTITGKDISAAPSDTSYTIRTVGPALSRIYSLYPVKYLIECYLQASNSEIIKAIIPQALVYASGEKAVNYFEQMIQLEGLDCSMELFYVLGTCRNPKAYKLLAEIYNEAVEKRPDLARRLSLAVIRFRGRIPMELLLRAVEAYQKTLEHINEKSFNSLPSNPLVFPLERGLAGNIKDWLQLRTHPNEDIASAARKALLRVRHPVMIDDIIKDCETLNPKNLGIWQEDYFQLFLESQTHSSKETLLRILQQGGHNHRNNVSVSNIIYLLLKNSDEKTIEELVRFGLHGSDWITIDCLKECVGKAPDKVKKFIYQIRSHKLTKEAHCRAILALALCGDKTVKKDLLSLFKIFISSETQRLNMQKAESNLCDSYFDFFCDALIATNAIECKSFLGKLANNRHNFRFCYGARRTLKNLGLKVSVYEKDIHELLVEIRSVFRNGVSSGIFSYELCDIISNWPIRKVKSFLIKMREVTERAITHQDKAKAQFFYHLTEKLRELFPSQRFLDIFSGWPTMPSPKT
jgi:hypothetical protein